MHEKIFTPLTTVWKAEFDGLIPLFTRDDLSPCVEKVDCMGVDHADAVDTAEIELCYRSAAFLRAQVRENRIFTCYYHWLNLVVYQIRLPLFNR